MLLYNNSYDYSRNKDNVIRELLTTTTESVLFLNSELEIIRINECANKKFDFNSLMDRSILAFLQKNSLKSSCHFANDISEPIKKKLLDKFNEIILENSNNVTWRVEYFPELFETDYKLALVDITYKNESNQFCNSVLDTVTNLVQTVPSNSSFNRILYNIIQSLPGRAHIKRSEDFAYMMTNAATLKLLGMEQSQQLIGLDDYLVSKHMGSRWPAKLAGELQELDHAIIKNNQPLLGKEETPYLDADNNLVVHSLTKIPIYSLDNKPFGILTLAMDITHLKDIMFLRQAYFNLYAKPKEAHYYFIKHLGLDKIHADINDLITIRELECLIFFAKGMTAKEIGRQLEISNRTVERHFESVKAKFNCLSRSDAISMFLSNFTFYTPGSGGYKSL